MHLYIIDLNITLIISDCEVWINALLGDHRKVEMMSFGRVIWINSAEQLNELREQKKENTEKTKLQEVMKVSKEELYPSIHIYIQM